MVIEPLWSIHPLTPWTCRYSSSSAGSRGGGRRLTSSRSPCHQATCCHTSIPHLHTSNPHLHTFYTFTSHLHTFYTFTPHLLHLYPAPPHLHPPPPHLQPHLHASIPHLHPVPTHLHPNRHVLQTSRRRTDRHLERRDTASFSTPHTGRAS